MYQWTLFRRSQSITHNAPKANWYLTKDSVQSEDKDIVIRVVMVFQTRSLGKFLSSFSSQKTTSKIPNVHSKRNDLLTRTKFRIPSIRIISFHFGLTYLRTL